MHLTCEFMNTRGRPGTHFCACKALYPSSILGAASGNFVAKVAGQGPFLV
jgi:hypothetical protein